MNDANAGALAEWRMGAGRGTGNMVVMTFGTGLTGKTGSFAELVLITPQCETYRIQEDHLSVYRLLCAVGEYELFDI